MMRIKITKIILATYMMKMKKYNTKIKLIKKSKKHSKENNVSYKIVSKSKMKK